MQFARLLVVQHVQEVTCNTVVVCLRVDFHGIGMKTMPVQEHRRQAGQQAIGDGQLIGKVAFGLDIAQERHASAQHVHRVRVSRNHFQNSLQRVGQTAIRLYLFDVGIEL